jgi:hypothetical protein
MKLTYWCSENLSDHRCYNLRAKTKKELVRKLQEEYDWDKDNYSEPFKVTVVYKNAFDLMEQCNSEGGIENDI